LLTDQDKISNLYRVPSIYVSYKGSVHLAKQFQRSRFLEIDQSESSIAYGGRLSTDQNETSNPYRGPSIDASYQVSVHLAKRFQRRRILKISQSETRIACGGHVC
jgi:hypothetical protein